MKREFKNITIAIINQRTHDFNCYDITDLDSYKESIRTWKEIYNSFGDEYEIQIIDCDYSGNLEDFDLYDFLLLCEKYQDVQPQEIMYLLTVCRANEVIEILEKGFFYTIIDADNKNDAFITYVKEFNLVKIPEHSGQLVNYKDIRFDFECNGLEIERVADRKYLIFNVIG